MEQRPPLPKGLDAEIRQRELQRFVRSVAVVDALLLAVVGLFFAVRAEPMAHPAAIPLAMAVYGALAVLLRLRRLFPRQTRLKLAAETWLMVAFITVTLHFSGKDESALVNLYLLPIIVCALTLGRVVTLLQVALVAALYMLLAAENPAVDVLSAAYLARSLGVLVPYLLVAWLTTTLAYDVYAARNRIENLAQTDTLTALFNLRTFNEIYKREHAAAERQGRIFTLLLIDLDGLKDINDSHGHEAGNSAIVLVANSILRSVRTTDFAARLGGDEFVVLLTGAALDSAQVVTTRIRNSVTSTSLNVGSRMIRCSVSIGVASYPKDSRDMKELLSLADRRMCRDKELRSQREPARA
jgi:diguanylate cyclase (GGDEF)-like protein